MSMQENNASPLVGYFESRGFKSFQMNGKKIFRSFGSFEREINSLQNGVGLRDISDSGIIELKGKDTLDFLHRISTNSVKTLAKEHLTNTIFTNEKGRILDVNTLINFEEFQLLVGSNEYKRKIISWINKYTITDDVKASDTSGKYALLELLGPQADSFITLLVGDQGNKLNEFSFRSFTTEGLLIFIFKLRELSGKSKFWIMTDPTSGEQLIDHLLNMESPFDFSLTGQESFEVYRVENGIPKVPNEINDFYNPHEVKLLRYVSFNKGCYIGQEVIARLDTYNKVQKYLAGAVFSEAVEHDDEYIIVDRDGNDIGKITSIAYSPKFNKHLGLILVKKNYFETNKIAAAVNKKGKTVEIQLTEVPFVK